MSTGIEPLLEDLVDVVHFLVATDFPAGFGDFLVQNSKEPGAHVRAPLEPMGGLHEREKRGLGHVFGRLRIETGSPGRTEDLRQVAVDYLLNRFRIPVLNASDELGVIRRCLLQYDNYLPRNKLDSPSKSV